MIGHLYIWGIWDVDQRDRLQSFSKEAKLSGRRMMFDSST